MLFWARHLTSMYLSRLSSAALKVIYCARVTIGFVHRLEALQTTYQLDNRPTKIANHTGLRCFRILMLCGWLCCTLLLQPVSNGQRSRADSNLFNFISFCILIYLHIHFWLIFSYYNHYIQVAHSDYIQWVSKKTILPSAIAFFTFFYLFFLLFFFCQ